MGDSLSFRLPDSVKYWMTPGDEQTVFNSSTGPRNSSADGYIRDVAHRLSLALMSMKSTSSIALQHRDSLHARLNNASRDDAVSGTRPRGVSTMTPNGRSALRLIHSSILIS